MSLERALNTIVSQFQIEIGDRIITPFGAGLINDTYRVKPTSEEGSFLLQRLNHYVFKEPEVVMENIHLVAECLKEQAYTGLILEPISTRSSQWLHQDEAGNYWRLFPFFENTYSIDQPDQADQVFKAARAFGRFLEPLCEMETSEVKASIPGFHDSVKRLTFFEKILAADKYDRRQSACS